MCPTFSTPYNFSISKAHKTQLILSNKIITEDRLPKKVKRVAGVDVAYVNELAIGAVAVLDYDSLETLEQQTATCKVKFPYIPTLLSFREIPPAVACIKKLRRHLDVLLVDGQGVAHPFGCGFAAHIGLAMGKPTFGVAKNKLFGEPKLIAGEVLLVQKEQIIGAAVTTKEGAKPVYVSVGHLISLKTAVNIARHCSRTGRIPEPILQAHKIASEESREFQEKHKTL
jgi:deoxyribonuclease V